MHELLVRFRRCGPLLGMPVPVMNIGEVGMRVGHRRMNVRMRMGTDGIDSRVMHVLVMFVVNVGMGVF